MTCKVRGLGEIALRVSDLNRMQEFYEKVVGLELMKRFSDSAFFRIAEGFEGHTQILALFDRSKQPGYREISGEKSTVDHFAFSIALNDFECETSRLAELGVKLKFSEHQWVQWRSLYFEDPEGNLIEFVCYDSTI